MSNKELTVKQKLQICLNLIKSGASISTARYAAKRYGVKLQFNQELRRKEKVAKKQITDTLCLAQGNTQAWLELKDSHANKSKTEKKQYRKSCILFQKYISKNMSLNYLEAEQVLALKNYIIVNDIKANCFVKKIIQKLQKLEGYKFGFIEAVFCVKAALRKSEIKNLKAVNKAANKLTQPTYVTPSVKGLHLSKLVEQAKKVASSFAEATGLSTKQQASKNGFQNRLKQVASLIKENALSTLLNATGKARKVVKDFAELVSDHCDMVIDWTLLSE